MRVIRQLICFLFSLSVYAQNEPENFNLYTTRDGLSSNPVYCLIQDGRQFLWIGTREGLNRFDGQRFKKFFSQKGNANSLAGNYIFDIIEYKYGQLLIATNNGLSVLNTLTGFFENGKISFAPLQAGSGVNIRSIHQMTDGQILVHHDGEIDLFNKELQYQYRLTDVDWAKALKGCLIYAKGITDQQHRLWFATDTSGFQIIDFSARQVWNHKNNPQKLSFLNRPPTNIRSFLLDEKNHTLWYADWGAGLAKYDLVTRKTQKKIFDPAEHFEFATVNSIIKKDEQHLLCFVGENMFELDIHSLSATRVIDKKNGLVCIQTADKKLWAGTLQGLMQLKSSTPGFKRLSLPAAGGQALEPSHCTSMAIAKNGRLYATYNNNAFFEIGKDRSSTTGFSITGRDNIVLSRLCEDKTGRIWVGTTEGVFLFDTSSQKFTQPAFMPKELRNMSINVLYCDHDGDVWIATRGVLMLYRVKAGQRLMERIRNPVIDRFASLNPDRVSSIRGDTKNNLWMSSVIGGGIIRFNKTSGQWKMYPVNNHDKSPLVTHGIDFLYPDSQNNLWIIDYIHHGLIRYNYLTDSFSRLVKEDGLPSDYTISGIADTSNNLWVSTSYGITKLNLEDHNMVSYSLDSKPPREYSMHLFDPVTNSLVYGLKDELLFIEVGGLRKDTSHVIPFADRITVNSKEISLNGGDRKLSLNHHENNISIEFTGVDFSGAHNTRFATQLSGLDTGWIFSDVNRSAHYANLAPGNYTFKIKTANENGEWSREYAALAFTIVPAFWQTTWFWLAVLSLTGLLISWLVRRRIKTIRREATLKHKLSEAEMIALRSQMNPHFIFNCLNAIDNLIQTGQADKATTYLARFARLIRSVLESSKNNVVPFDRDFETLQLFLDLEQFRCNNKFTYEISADDELLNGDYKVPPLIIQPFVENAIHHGLLNKESGQRRVIVKAGLENNSIQYLVQDNGVGRTKASEIKELNKPEHQSYGIQITSERIHLYNQNGHSGEDIIITDLMEKGKAAGTVVKVTLAIR